MSERDVVARMDQLVSHLWMVRTFLKHSEEAEEDDEVAEVHRELYDFMLALGGPSKENDDATYLKVAKKKLRKIRKAADLFVDIQPEVSTHTNFRMCAISLQTIVIEMETLLS